MNLQNEGNFKTLVCLRQVYLFPYPRNDYARTNPWYCLSTADIDECSEQSSGCQQNCTNTVGSFHCSCSGGYNLDTDGLSCTQGKLFNKVNMYDLVFASI